MVKKPTIDSIRDFIESCGYKLLSKKYINAKSKLYILCKEHGIFSMNWNNFKSGQRCRGCSDKNRFSWNKHNIKELLKSTDYTYFGHRKSNRRVYVTVICGSGHRSEVRLDSIQRGQGCFECANDNLRLDIEYVGNYIKERGFTLLSEDYKNNEQSLEIKCPIHGKFHKRFSKFKEHPNCPFCANGAGVREQACRDIFENSLEVKFPNTRCKFLTNPDTGYCLELDGYSEDLRLAFEYDGLQHYEPVDFFGGKEAYAKRRQLDALKDELCRKEKINLIRIPYYVRNLEEYIERQLEMNGFKLKKKVDE